MDSFSFLSGPTMNTARAVKGIPALSISSGSSMPYLRTPAACILHLLECAHQDAGCAVDHVHSSHECNTCIASADLQDSNFPLWVRYNRVINFAARCVCLNILDPPEVALRQTARAAYSMNPICRTHIILLYTLRYSCQKLRLRFVGLSIIATQSC